MPRSVLVLGMGDSGIAAARYCAARLGSEFDKVTVVDSGDHSRLREAAARLIGAGAEVLLGVDAVDGTWDLGIASPGIPPSAPLMVSARSACGEVVSEIEFAYRCSDTPWIAVTGTNGKTTTTALLRHLLLSGGVPARAVGNIGTPAIGVVDEGTSEVLVAEVSSFQLALSSTFHPRVAVLLNITPDHLDWHGGMYEYTTDKARVFQNLTLEDTAVIDVDDAGSAPWANTVAAAGVPVVRVSLKQAHSNGATIVNGVLTLETEGGPIRLVSVDELQICGSHNVSNALCAAAAAHSMGVAAVHIADGLRTFRPIEHRLEPAGEAHGMEWFNDSKATNPDAVVKAVEAFEGRSLVLLAGGRNKGNSFEALARAAAGRVRTVVVFGEARAEIASAFEAVGIPVKSTCAMAEAIAAVQDVGSAGDVVLLSPACASFDEFENYEERGSTFKRLVAALAEEAAR